MVFGSCILFFFLYCYSSRVSIFFLQNAGVFPFRLTYNQTNLLMQSHLPDKRYTELAEKWLNGSINPGEEKEFAAWYNHGQDTPVYIPDTIAQSEDEHRLKIFGGIIRQRGQVVPMRKRMMRIASIAACLLLLAGTGYLYFRSTSLPKESITKMLVVKNDVLPGLTRATLTLDDGKQIVLDTARNGLVAQQGNATILNKDGVLVYDAFQKDGPLRYNTLTTHKGEQYPLTLSDGTKIMVDASTTVRFPVAFTGKERTVEINGRAWFEVAKNSDMPFYVIKGDKKVRVLGTRFDVNAYDNEADLKVTLVEGSVQVVNGLGVGMLKPGQQAILAKSNSDIKVVEDADVEQAIAWKNGIIAFHDADITTMREIERWYNVDVEIKGELPKRLFYFDVSRKARLSEILKVFEIYKVHSTIDEENRKLTIML
jgi:transmembrane sensor